MARLYWSDAVCPDIRTDWPEMPEISRFLGIVVRMFVEVGGPHHRPHFHAYYQGHVGVFAIDTIERIGGLLPTRQERLVIEWAEIHRREPLDNWAALQEPAVKPLGLIP